METIIFFKYFGSTVFAILLITGLFYWILTIFSKSFPDWKFWIKYKLFKREFGEGVMNFLADDLEKGVESEEMFKTMLISGKIGIGQARELQYIFKELQRGYKNE